MIKEETDSSDFLDSLHTQQELMLCVDTDKVQPYIEDCIAHKEPLVKVDLTLLTHFKDLIGCFQLLLMSRLRNSVQSSYKSIASVGLQVRFITIRISTLELLLIVNLRTGTVTDDRING